MSGASLGRLESSSGRIESGDLRHWGRGYGGEDKYIGTDAFTYRAGDREGTDDLQLEIEHPECEGSGDFRIPVDISRYEWEFTIHADYEGLTGRTGIYGEVRWHGYFTVVEGDRMEGRGTYFQVDSGECFYHVVQNEFRVGGAVEDAHFRFEFLDYENLSRLGPLVPEDLRCVVKAAAQGVDLLAGVAKNAAQFEEAVVPVPGEGEFSERVVYETFTIDVYRH